MAERPDGLHGTSWTARLRNSFITGVVVAGPLAITVYLAKSFLEWVDATVKPMVPAAWNPDSYLPFALPGFGLVVALLGFTMLGALMASLLGRTMLSYGEQLVDRMPFVRPVYKTLKQVFETFVANKEQSFRQVGLIEWPRPGIWSIVFVAGPVRGEIARRIGEARAARLAEAERLMSAQATEPDNVPEDVGTASGALGADGSTAEDDVLAVFIPTTPNPTGGYLMFLPAADVTILGMSVEDAAKFVISGGIVAPEGRGASEAVAAPSAPPEHGSAS
ncbi:DUF502 domain-containing protein [Methyloraptor flagellatus]|uniref:DUF502 domain-containing protein n=1 Tax=Methyloraptor flagellatus TaxID=3162530 RepID=A0AAU7XH37_9HYPH